MYQATSCGVNATGLKLSDWTNFVSVAYCRINGTNPNWTSCLSLVDWIWISHENLHKVERFTFVGNLHCYDIFCLFPPWSRVWFRFEQGSCTSTRYNEKPPKTLDRVLIEHNTASQDLIDNISTTSWQQTKIICVEVWRNKAAYNQKGNQINLDFWHVHHKGSKDLIKDLPKHNVEVCIDSWFPSTLKTGKWLSLTVKVYLQ